MSQLYGKALANQIPDSTTGNQARVAFGAMSATLHAAYEKLAEYDPSGIGQWTGIDAGSGQAARNYLDSANDAMGKYYQQMPQSDDPLSSELLTKFKAAVSISSTACQYIDENFSTAFLGELTDAVIDACATVVGRVANGVSKVAGSFVGGTWWIWLLGIAGFVLLTKYKKATRGTA